MKNGLRVITGVVVSVALTVALTLLLAVSVKIFYLGTGFVKIPNQIIKIACILVATRIGVTEKGLLCGSTIGLAYAVITSILFGIIGGNFSFDVSFLLNLIFCTASGVIGGVIFANLKK